MKEPHQSAPSNETARERYWRSLEDLAGTGDFQRLLQNEFPTGASEWPAKLDRRSFLSLMTASFALAGLTGCTRQPLEEIVPYVNQPEEITLGKPLYFATAMPLGGFGTGILVKSREGRPIKADGNPLHPSSLGGSSIWIQACLLDLYDPDRAKTVTHQGQPSTWALLTSAVREILAAPKRAQGAGVRILTETVTSPTTGAQLARLLQQFPEAKWHQYEPINRDNVIAGSELAFGQYVSTRYDLTRAKVILSLDSDFLYTHPERLRHSRHFTDARRVVARGTEMNRLYVAEPSPSITGAMADQRMPMSSAQIEAAARILLRELGQGVPPSPVTISNEQQEWLSAVARELQANRATSLVTVGEFQSPALQAMEHALNAAVGNLGQTVSYFEPAEFRPARQVDSLQDLAHDMQQGKVECLVIIGGNPVFNAPVDFEFAQAMRSVNHTLHLTVAPNETSAACAWTIPRAHFLETWSDIRAFDGTATIMQPLIAPLFDGHSEHELLSLMTGFELGSYEVVRDFWRGRDAWDDFEKGWRQAVHDGVVEKTACASRQVKLRSESIASLDSRATAPRTELAFRPDPNLWDGCFANNAWLLEAPKPISKLVWDNAALVSPALAGQRNLASGDVVEFRTGDRTLRAAVLVLPGQAENVVTLHLGYGRTDCGRAGQRVGFNAFSARASENLWTGPAGPLTKTGARHELVTTQAHQRLNGDERQIFRAVRLDDLRLDRSFVKERVEQPGRDDTLYDPGEFEFERKWGMVIDLTSCIGCNACLMACNIENNIPVVGKQQVAMNREMLWLRIDTYFEGAASNPRMHFEPVPCMQCENAPCEYVCPVEASIHDSEGLNLQVYNRCVGTRYCSNNCPYKVRRFNFLNHTKLSEVGALRQNPEVTVRSRGVMEKCTYCVQRISAARIEAKKANREIRDGEARTACQEACPASAIVFGVMTDSNSEVSKYKRHALNFSMLGQLNTRPRTTYLAKVINPNRDLVEASGSAGKERA